VEHNLVTDPYSFSLSMNSTRSQIVDLDESALKPAGWETLAKPELAAPEDVSIYELHVRDFSADDPTVPEELPVEPRPLGVTILAARRGAPEPRTPRRRGCSSTPPFGAPLEPRDGADPSGA
jgi:1,4-alpha-glucan branching enzyme